MFDDRGDAETQMSQAFGCIVIVAIGIAAMIIGGIVLLVKYLL